jgi:hypothetical protein
MLWRAIAKRVGYRYTQQAERAARLAASRTERELNSGTVAPPSSRAIPGHLR